ncbi:hypothetical protein IGI04_037320 [Brassica rapa subsp. trilocularis]|uniref:Uncharacterized protein n=1 Tax=Brassica rapa subsp. trilocularis TaxID=1813537 RepID=A0ABQ7LIQ3_BRACM|nr:hypothetical protein IGI04_037320 [Brassica rapa subsp. trilocularis]
MNTRPDESLQSSPGASKETRRITIDGEDELETNRSTRTVKAKARAAKSDVADLRIDEEFNRLQSIFKPPTYLHGTTDIFIDLSKLEDATTQTIGDEETIRIEISGEPRKRAGESDVEKTITSRRQKPAKTVLWKPPLPRSKAGRSSEELMQRRSPRPVGNTETGTQKQRTLSPLNQLITF